jgi:hypothetical protein
MQIPEHRTLNIERRTLNIERRSDEKVGNWALNVEFQSSMFDAQCSKFKKS